MIIPSRERTASLVLLFVCILATTCHADCIDTISSFECPRDFYSSIIAEINDTELEGECIAMRQEGCCLVESSRIAFKKKAVNYQTWKCPEQHLRQRRAFTDDERPSRREEDVKEFTHQQVLAPWNLDRLDTIPYILDGAYTPLQLTAQNGDVHIYIIDTGIFPSHSGFSGVPVSLDYPNPLEAQDCNGHGTHVASIVASSQTGVVPENGRVVLHSIRVLDCAGSGTTTSVVAGIAWVLNNIQRPGILNLSLGGPRSAILDDIINTARADFGLLSIVAAGNENTDACTRSPSGAVGSISVGATRFGDFRASYSNFGSCVNIFAPGSDVDGAGIASASQIIRRSGTSMAAPHVAGALARLALTDPAARTAVDSSVWDDVLARSTVGAVQDARPGSANILLFVGDTSRPPPTFTIPPPSAGSSTQSPSEWALVLQSVCVIVGANLLLQVV